MFVLVLVPDALASQGIEMTGDAREPQEADPGRAFWVTPQSWVDDDLEAGRLPSLKGMTPVELPALGGGCPFRG